MSTPRSLLQPSHGCLSAWRVIRVASFSSTTPSSPLTSASTPKKTFHRRELPTSLIAFSSKEGRQLFNEALAARTMESYFPLSEQFITQSEPSYCSLSSLAMVLNALNHDPQRTWKGVWRWVTEDTLQCENHNFLCKHSLDKIQREGMDFKDFELLGECHNVTIDSFRSPNIGAIDMDSESKELYEVGLERFRETVLKSCTMNFDHDEVKKSTSSRYFVISNFSRKVLGQTGDGHFSPIGGYHTASDCVLIMDVARFKYPPYWVPVTKLWESMAVDDALTKMPRGYFVIKSS